MTATRLIIIVLISTALFDFKFNNGRLVGAVWSQATQVGVWVNTKVSILIRYAAPG
jgi:hypothetical protein